MRIAVIGAGLAGMVTAWVLAREGHEVCVFERQEAVAAQASFAAAGLSDIALPALDQLRPRRWPWWQRTPPGLEAAWRGPAAERLWLQRARRQDQAARQRQARALVRLARLGRSVQALLPQPAEDRPAQPGALLLWSGTQEPPATAWLGALQDDLGLPLQDCGAPVWQALEPALAQVAAPAHAVLLPQARQENLRLLCMHLREVCERELAVRFQLGAHVRQLNRSDTGVVLSVETAGTPAQPTPDSRRLAFLPTRPLAPEPVQTFDTAVLCCGHMRPPGWPQAGRADWPLQPLWGASATFRLRDDRPECELRGAVVDMEHGITLARMGRRLRASGLQRLGTTPDAATTARWHAALYAAVERWCPAGVRRDGVQLWTGARPALPDGLPLIGEVQPRVWVNLGLGHWGGTLAAGAALLLAQQLAGGACAIDPAPYAPGRWA